MELNEVGKNYDQNHNVNDDDLREDHLNMNLDDGMSNKFSESLCSGRFKKSEMPRTGGSMLSVMEEIVKVGQAMGYNMEGCVNNITKIIESQGAPEVHR